MTSVINYYWSTKSPKCPFNPMIFYGDFCTLITYLSIKNLSSFSFIQLLFFDGDLSSSDDDSSTFTCFYYNFWGTNGERDLGSGTLEPIKVFKTNSFLFEASKWAFCLKKYSGLGKVEFSKTTSKTEPGFGTFSSYFFLYSSNF